MTSSSRRFVPGSRRFSGTTVCIAYGVDGTGMKPGDQCSGWLCITSSAGEYKIPFEIHAEKDSFRNTQKEIKIWKPSGKSQKDFREAYRLFNDKCFPEMMEKADNRQKALYAGLSHQPVTYQNLEEFLWA